MPMQKVEVLRAACCIAGLDGTIDEAEQRLLERLAKRAGVGPVSLTAMMDRARGDPNFYQEQFRFLSSDPRETLTVIVGVAVADGVLSTDERVVLDHLAQRLGASREEFHAILDAAERYLQQRAARDAGGEA